MFAAEFVMFVIWEWTDWLVEGGMRRRLWGGGLSLGFWFCRVVDDGWVYKYSRLGKMTQHLRGCENYYYTKISKYLRISGSPLT